LRYFGRRHALHEELHLLSVDVGTTWVAGGASFSYRLTRTADDLPPETRLTFGKGELSCARKTIYVWSMGPGTARNCPGAETASVEGPIVACARAGRAPTAQEVSAAFRVRATPLTLPPACRASPVRDKVLRLLRALNVGDGRAFVRDLAPSMFFHPGTRSPVPRAAIPGFVSARYHQNLVIQTLPAERPAGRIGTPETFILVGAVAVGGVPGSPVRLGGVFHGDQDLS